MNKKVRVSIVVPVYNEEEHLAACLEAIAHQTVSAFEVIVVDNNSTDASMAIAVKYPFVRVVTEKHQGLVYARNTGFDAATGEVIGRIDADTIVPNNWVEKIVQLFQTNTLDAASGSITYCDILFTNFFEKVELFFRKWVAAGLEAEGFLYGGNMAMRQSAWQSVRNVVCQQKGLHEDLDLGIHVKQTGGTIAFEPALHVDVHLRRFDSTFWDFLQWAWITPYTYHKHGLRHQTRTYCVVLLATIFYLPLKFLHKAYDTKTKKFSWTKLFSPTVQRVNPATFVD